MKQLILTEYDKMIQYLSPHRAHKPFRYRIHVLYYFSRSPVSQVVLGTP